MCTAAGCLPWLALVRDMMVSSKQHSGVTGSSALNTVTRLH